MAFLAAEFEACGIAVTASPGDTRCSGANKCHYDLSGDQSQFEALCRGAMAAGRQASRLKKAAMKEIVEGRNRSCTPWYAG